MCSLPCFVNAFARGNNYSDTLIFMMWHSTMTLTEHTNRLFENQTNLILIDTLFHERREIKFVSRSTCWTLYVILSVFFAFLGAQAALCIHWIWGRHAPMYRSTVWSHAGEDRHERPSKGVSV